VSERAGPLQDAADTPFVYSHALQVLAPVKSSAAKAAPTPKLGLSAPGHPGEAADMSDLRERAPAHSLIDELLRQWDLGTIHVDTADNSVVIDDEALGWYRGVIGERRIADLLRELGEGWTVLHSVPVGKGTSDIDHVVIGPSGVFTINTKYSPNKDVWASGLGMYVGGFKQQYIRNSVGEARRASELLSNTSRLTVPVTGVLAFVDVKNLTIKTTPGEDDGPEIKIVRDVRLLAALRGQQVFSEEQVAAIVGAAVRPETWHQSPSDSTKANHIIREFEALEAEVGERLAVARVIPSQHTARRPSKTTARPSRQSTNRAPSSYANTSRQSTSRSPANRSRKKKETATERMVSQLLIAGVGIVVFLGAAAVLMHR